MTLNLPWNKSLQQTRHRTTDRHRQLNAAIYRTVIVRMRFHEPTIAYVARRTAKGKTNETSSDA